MKTIEVPNSTAIQRVSVSDDNIVTITFNSGNSYNYQDKSGNFVQNVQNRIENGQSVGQFFNRALKEDQTLQIIAN